MTQLLTRKLAGLFFITLSMMLFAPTVSFAAKTISPDMIIGALQLQGRVNSIDTARRSIIVSGNKFYYGINTRVHTATSDHASMYSVRKGDEIGFRYVTDKKGNYFLSEVWVLPAGTIKLDR